MKKVSFFLSILIFFQSCYSYQKFELKNYNQIKPKKVKIELLNSKIIKGEIIAFQNDELILKTISKTKNIQATEIKEIKKREFSWIKTNILGVVISTAVLLIILEIILKGISNGVKF